MVNFEAFRRVILSSIKPLFLKSDMLLLCSSNDNEKKSLKFVVNLSGSRTSSLPFFPGFHDVAWLFRHQSALTWTLRPLLNPVIKFWYETQINYLGFCGIFFCSSQIFGCTFTAFTTRFFFQWSSNSNLLK